MIASQSSFQEFRSNDRCKSFAIEKATGFAAVLKKLNERTTRQQPVVENVADETNRQIASIGYRLEIHRVQIRDSKGSFILFIRFDVRPRFLYIQGFLRQETPE